MSWSLMVSAQYGRGIVSKDDLIFTGGGYEISATDHGLVGDNISVGDGSFYIKASEDALNSKADILIAGDDGIDSNGNIYVAGGNLRLRPHQ